MLSLFVGIISIILTQLANPQRLKPKENVLARHEFSLEERYHNEQVNNVFKDNILLTIRYATGEKINPLQIDWNKIREPFQAKLVLNPGDTFAFHDDVLPQYQSDVKKTTNAHFNISEGFKSDGYLVGDGVCHLASLLYWVAKDANLSTLAPTRHDFAPVPGVPEKYGVSIYSNPEKNYSDELQNLYISNTKDRPIAFVFDFDGNKLSVKAVD